MKLVIALDSFKGSISAPLACRAIETGLKRACPDIQVILKPIADGGEGTLDALTREDQRYAVTVCGPCFEKITAQYGAVRDTAIIEMACAAGLTLVAEEKRNAGQTTTFGVGEMILHALANGFRRIMLTAGGSATNDGGCGMFAALGAVFKDAEGKSFIPTGDSLERIADIDISDLPSALFECEITIATDVKNPLIGEHGATFVYAPQKGLAEGQRERLEGGMCHYAHVLRKVSGRDIATVEGAGAGGGIGAPLLAFFGAKIRSGIETVLDVVDFDAALDGADAVITGEGKMDAQSLYGKAVSGVTARAKKHGVPVYGFVGCVGDDVDTLKEMGVRDIYTVASMAESTEDSMKNADKYLALMAECFLRDHNGFLTK